VVKPRVRLVGFQRVDLKAGASAKVTIPIEVARMRYWDETRHAFAADPGRYELHAGFAADNLPLHAAFALTESP